MSEAQCEVSLQLWCTVSAIASRARAEHHHSLPIESSNTTLEIAHVTYIRTSGEIGYKTKKYRKNVKEN